ncbi:MAG: hypothetical protein ACRD1T_18360, partial [Acidimicrobiia bacterium]
LLINLGDALTCSPAPEPLLAPPEGRDWELLLSTNDTRYDGAGAEHPLAPRPVTQEERGPVGMWHLSAHTAVILTSPARSRTA